MPHSHADMSPPVQSPVGGLTQRCNWPPQASSRARPIGPAQRRRGLVPREQRHIGVEDQESNPLKSCPVLVRHDPTTRSIQLCRLLGGPEPWIHISTSFHREILPNMPAPDRCMDQVVERT